MKAQKPFYIRNTCRCCDSSELRMVLPMEPSPPGDEYLDSPDLETSPVAPMDVWQCRNCGHAQLRCVYNPEILYGRFTYETQISLGLDNHFTEYADEAYSIAGLCHDDLVIDVGSNDGTLLSKFQKKGIKVHGVDPALQAAQKAIERGIPTTISFLTKDLAEGLLRDFGRPKLITTNNTFANIDKLSNFIQAIRHLMSRETIFCLETGYGPWIATKGLFETIYHEHLGYFSLRDLLNLMRINGMVMQAASLNDSKGGCLRTYFRQGDASNLPIQAEKILFDEKEAAYTDGKPWESLGSKIQNSKNDLKNYLEKKKGKIGSFGASVSTTTFLLNLGLDHWVSCLFDENPIKHGKFSPVGKIPVFGVSPRLAGCEVVIINAWRYRDSILKKHQKINPRTHWLSVWPELI